MGSIIGNKGNGSGIPINPNDPNSPIFTGPEVVKIDPNYVFNNPVQSSPQLNSPISTPSPITGNGQNIVNAMTAAKQNSQILDTLKNLGYIDQNATSYAKGGSVTNEPTKMGIRSLFHSIDDGFNSFVNRISEKEQSKNLPKVMIEIPQQHPHIQDMGIMKKRFGLSSGGQPPVTTGFEGLPPISDTPPPPQQVNPNTYALRNTAQTQGFVQSNQPTSSYPTATPLTQGLPLYFNQSVTNGAINPLSYLSQGNNLLSATPDQIVQQNNQKQQQAIAAAQQGIGQQSPTWYGAKGGRAGYADGSDNPNIIPINPMQNALEKFSGIGSLGVAPAIEDAAIMGGAKGEIEGVKNLTRKSVDLTKNEKNYFKNIDQVDLEHEVPSLNIVGNKLIVKNKDIENLMNWLDDSSIYNENLKNVPPRIRDTWRDNSIINKLLNSKSFADGGQVETHLTTTTPPQHGPNPYGVASMFKQRYT